MENPEYSRLPQETVGYEYIGPDGALTTFIHYNQAGKYLLETSGTLLHIPEGTAYLSLDFVPDKDESGVHTELRSITRYYYLWAAGLDGLCSELAGNPLLSEIHFISMLTNRRMARFAMDTAGFDWCFFDFDVAKEPNVDVLKAKMLERESGIRIGTLKQKLLLLQPRFRELSQKLSGRVNGTE
jgi:hypothetical protein